MKKLSIMLVFMLLLSLCLAGCTRVSVSSKKPGELVFSFPERDVDIHQILTQEETDALAAIVNGKSMSFENSSCGFYRDVCFIIDGTRFCPACDTCNGIRVYGIGMEITVSQEDIQFIHDLFEKYGGEFPCI